MPKLPPIASGLLLAVALLASGCPSTHDRQLLEKLTAEQAKNDKLRDDLKKQQQQVEQLTGQLANLANMPADRWNLVPQAQRIELDGLSGLRAGRPQLNDSPATQSDAGGQFVRLYLLAFDQQGRRIRAAGPMKISLFDLSAAQPRSLGEYSFDAPKVAEHFRSALASELYAYDLPLAAPAPREGVTVRVELTDVLTGKTLTAQKLLILPKP